MKSIWPKTIAFTPEHSRVWVDQPGSGVGWFEAPPDLDIVLTDGEPVGQLREVIMAVYHVNFAKLIEQIGMRDIDEDREQFMLFQVGPPWTVQKDGVEHHLYLRWVGEERPAEFHRIEAVEIGGPVVINVSEVSMMKRRLGEVRYAYGEGKLGDQDALASIRR